LLLVQLGCGGSPKTTAAAEPMVIKSVSLTAVPDGSSYTMEVYGSGFLSDAVVLVENSVDASPFVPTTFVDSTHLTATVPATTIGNSGFTIYVYSATVPNCSDQYCDLGYWSNLFIGEVPGH
jgi:hypothetical protein